MILDLGIRYAPSLEALLAAVGLAGEDGVSTAAEVARYFNNRDAMGSYAQGQSYAQELRRCVEAGLVETGFNGKHMTYALTEVGRVRAFPAPIDARWYLRRVEERARELYALSDQGEWDGLDPVLRGLWIGAADRELRPTLGGRLEFSGAFRPGIPGL